MREENGDTIRDRDGERGASGDAGVAVGVETPQPPFPPRRMNEDVTAVHLLRGGQAAHAIRGRVADEGVPPTHDVADRLRATRAEGSEGARRREGVHTEGGEVVDDLYLV